jgi:hypothetical protein
MTKSIRPRRAFGKQNPRGRCSIGCYNDMSGGGIGSKLP